MQVPYVHSVRREGAVNIPVSERQGRATQAEFHACELHMKLTRKCRMCAEEMGTGVASDRNKEKN
ncbi:hypothetical protein AB205_0204180 [Aquarana catesbeiana]|uniref:Uncharacterized protein n=1 Tax=Aquarana catesbeiana TaxID=8400 RepID=A0A2G9Q5S9_AQUCT|nr:hypothetical protein AB205_0204180 [Aquarana catesbeiana]